MLDFYKGKKVFVTGHTGFKGAWLCQVLIKAGAEVTGYALEPQTSPSLFEVLGLGESSIHSIIGDVCDGVALTEAVVAAQPEIMIHMAAQPLVRESYRNPVKTYATNVMGTVNILEALRVLESTNPGTVKSFVNVTTDKVYENQEWIWGYREDERLNGHDPYSNSKSCSELVTASYKKSFDLPAISTARSGNVIGGGDFAADRIIPDCYRAAVKSESVVLRNPTSTRPYQHVLECLPGYLTLAQAQYEDADGISGSFNFGPRDESNVTTEQLVGLFADAWGLGFDYEVKPDGGPHEANFLKLDISKAGSVLGWTPHWDIRTAVDKAATWYKAYDGGDAVECTNRQIDAFFS
ncbi:MAG: CDP-glucose 4,6-dehydratase [Clostridiales Family XIII bacterium]|nr:CDP-glucose 4,6-dehydratase [Clostridiales Family XIII bacterium]